MTYRWSQKQISDMIEAIHEGYKISSEDLYYDLVSILAAMELTDQKYVYIKGQPEY